MQAIILAAGMGRRLHEYTRDNTKCMLEVNGVKLIDRALECLHNQNVSRIILVVGYKGDNVKKHVGNSYKGTKVLYVDNPVYDKTNNIYSLFLARGYLAEEDTLLLESDLIFEPTVIQKIMESPLPNLALVDKYESWMDGTVVTLDNESRITRFIGKDNFRFEEIKTYYKTVNIYKFSRAFSCQYYIPFLSAYCTALGNNEYYEQVLRVILHLHDAPLFALRLEGETWYEIDDVQDLDIASGMFASTPGDHYSSITSRYGGYWRYPQMLDFCYLVNPFFPPQRMLDEIKASFETLVTNYPSGMKVNSLLAAKNFNVRRDFIAVGNGAAELIKAYMENEVGTLGIITPTFEEYPNRLTKERVIPYSPKNDGFTYSAAEIKAFFSDKEISTLLLINPDNPSGNYIPFNELHGLIGWTKQRGIRFLVDESFVDFADTVGPFSLLDNDILSNNPHVVVVKSISKSFGVPGFRLGIIASGDTNLISAIKNNVAIWNINSFGEFYLQIYEKYDNDYKKACACFREERDIFFKELSNVPFLTVYPSQANFFLCKVNDRFSSKELAFELLSHNILIKDCSTKKGFGGASFIRIAVRDRKDNANLVAVLKAL